MMQFVEHVTAGYSVLKIEYEKENGIIITIRMEYELLEPGTIYKYVWTHLDIDSVNPMSVPYSKLVVEAISNKPNSIEFGECHVNCIFSVSVGPHTRDVAFILLLHPRAEVAIAFSALAKRSAIIERAYLTSALVPLNMFSQVNEQCIPISYMRISEQFPHLSLPEIIGFDKKVRENGGSISTHSGQWTYVDRTCNQVAAHDANQQCKEVGPGWKNGTLSWKCCGPYTHNNTFAYHATDIRVHKLKCAYHNPSCMPNPARRGFEYDNSGDFTNRAPDSKCTSAIIFFLHPPGEKEINVAEEQVKNARVAIQKNIGMCTHAIGKLEGRVARLSEIDNALGLLDISDSAL
jgi:hypothetical protein